MPAPAPRSIMTRWPCWVSSRTEPGTSPTRFSLLLISLGTPISMVRLLQGFSIPGRQSPVPRQPLFDVAQHLGENAEQLVDLILLDDQRRRECDDITGGADQQPLLETFHERFIGPRTRLARPRRQLDAGDQADVADVDDVRQP